MTGVHRVGKRVESANAAEASGCVHSKGLMVEIFSGDHVLLRHDSSWYIINSSQWETGNRERQGSKQSEGEKALNAVLQRQTCTTRSGEWGGLVCRHRGFRGRFPASGALRAGLYMS